jgi:hypothetical protein
MPTKKIADLPRQQYCRHPDHNPPSMMVYPPGIYEHTCPSCGHRVVFRVEPMICGGGGRRPRERDPRDWDPPRRGRYITLELQTSERLRTLGDRREARCGA